MQVLYKPHGYSGNKCPLTLAVSRGSELYRDAHLQCWAVGLDVQSHHAVVQGEGEGQAGRQQLILVLLHSETHLQGGHEH